MTELFLHHYPASPYSEKMRAIFGFKGLAWRSVITPAILPKPELLPLTGGYRKAPVMQVGRDVIFDTALMARVLDRLHPKPALVPQEHRASCAAFASLDQTLFFAAVPTVFQPAGLQFMAQRMGPETFAAFGKDREAFFAGGAVKRPNAEFAKTNFLPLVHGFDQQLAAAPFLLGEAATLADFVVYHSLWFVNSNPGVAGILAPFKHLADWLKRMAAFGHGQPIETSGEDALAAARTCNTWLDFDGPLLEPEKIKLGQQVLLRATDYGVDAVEGRLVHASVFEWVLEREDPRAGTVRIHAPRSGFSLSPA